MKSFRLLAVVASTLVLGGGAALAASTWTPPWGTEWYLREETAKGAAPDCWSRKQDLDKEQCGASGKAKILKEGPYECDEKSSGDGRRWRCRRSCDYQCVPK